jgi:TetR/AcrR family transcriptional regulator, transcriptional repressor of aconitase
MEDEKQKLRIIEVAGGKFLQFGFSRVSMDEIAAELGISKKTLYLHFSGKDYLVRAVVQKFMKETVGSIMQIVQNPSLDLVDRLHGVFTVVGMGLSRVSHPFLEDVQKYAPEVWAEINDFRHNMIIKNFGKLIDEGVRQGVFRPDLDKELLVEIYAGVIRTMLNPEALLQSRYSANQVFEHIVRVIFQGILTDQARAKYDKNLIVNPGTKGGRGNG